MSLTLSLQAENVRWSDGELELESQMKTVCGDVLLASAFVSYAGCFTQPYRHQLLHQMLIPFLQELRVRFPLSLCCALLVLLGCINTVIAFIAAFANFESPVKECFLLSDLLWNPAAVWPCLHSSRALNWIASLSVFLFSHLSIQTPIPLSHDLDPVLTLTDPAALAAWHNQGLPADRLSVENAAILITSQRWPLIVDPQLQASKWIRNLYGPNMRFLQYGQKGWSPFSLLN